MIVAWGVFSGFGEYSSSSSNFTEMIHKCSKLLVGTDHVQPNRSPARWYDSQASKEGARLFCLLSKHRVDTTMSCSVVPSGEGPINSNNRPTAVV